MPGLPAVFLILLVPAVLYHYPQVMDCRFGALMMVACAGGTVLARRLLAAAEAAQSSASPRKPGLTGRPWFAIWAGYAITIAAPAAAYQVLFGRIAVPASWAPLWPGGSFMLDGPMAGFTDGLLLASVPAAVAAFCMPRTKPDEPPAAAAQAGGFPAAAAARPRGGDVPPARPRGFLARAVLHAGPLAVFAAAAALLSLRIPPQSFLSYRIDPILSAWNFWWFHKALLDPALSIIHSDYVFQPFGVNFLWHTFEPLNCLAASAYQELTGAGLIETYNVITMATFALIGWTGYLLGRRLGGVWAGFFAGFALMFSGSHLGQVREGHLDLACAQWVILFFLFAIRAFEKGRALDAAAAGVMWAAAFYTHFYLAIFCGTIYVILLLAAVGRWAGESGGVASTFRAVRGRFSGPIALPVLAIAATVAFQHRWYLWLMAAGAAVILAAGRSAGGAFARRWWKAAVLPPVIFAAAAGPWLAAMFLENASLGGTLDYGRYPGLYSTDLLGYLVPCPVSRGSAPFEFIWSKFLIPSGDSSAFLGFPVIALAAYGLVRNRKPLWVLMAVLFALISLGPKLHVAGATVTGWRMPYVALDAMPFLSASGVAARYSLPATIAIVMIAAAGLGHLMGRLRAGGWGWGGIARLARPAVVGALATGAVIAASYPPFFFYRPPQPALLQMIKDDPSPGVVVAFAPIDTALWFQTIHGKKMVNGFASRIPPRVRAFILETPVLRDIQFAYRLQQSRDEAMETLRGYGIRWIIVAEGRSRRTIEADLGLRPCAVEDDVYLYRLK